MAHLLVIESWYSGIGYRFLDLIRQMGHTFTFVASNPYAYLARPPADAPHPLLAADHILTADTNDLPALVEFLEREHARLQFDGVTTACDYYLEHVAQVAARLGLPGPPPLAEETARLKHRMRQALDAAGLPNAAFRVADDWPAVHAAADALGYPVVLKPVDEGGSMFVTCVSDAVELRAAFDRLAAYGVNQRGQTRTPLYLLEEYLRGEEVSVEAYGCDGQTHVLGITDKSVTGFPDFIEDGHMFPAPLEPAVAEATCDLVRRALGVIGYTHGVSHTEVKLTPSGPRIVEINPRSGGNRISELVKLVTGVDLLEVVVELALGRRPNARPFETDICSAAVAFLLPQRAGYVRAVHGVDSFSVDPDLVDVTLKPIAGTRVAPSRHNDYLGSVIYADRVGSGARARAQRAIRQITLEFADEEVADDAAG